ncbi:MAG: DNA repair protein RadC [Chloroflexota bacterium]|nr:DNA repair protein RadC [Chloroflexota bacterium]
MRDPLAELEAEWAAADAEQARRSEQAEEDRESPAPAPRAGKKRRKGIDGLAPDDQPRERLMRLGAASLSNTELLAVLLSTGDQETNVLEKSRELLADRGLVGLLRSDLRDLMRVTGLGPAKVTRVKAAVELAARGLADDEWPAREPFRSGRQVFERYRALLGDLIHEEVWVLVLDQQHCLIREERLYKGMVHGASVRVAELLRPVIVHQGPAMIVVHNHPSGSSAPSAADRVMTSELAQSAQTMGIELLDHVIVTRSSFASMAQMGLLTSSSAGQAAAAPEIGDPSVSDGYRA